MSTPIDRLRSADPARDLGTQPDERGEADLRILLAEPQPPHPAPAPPRPERRRVAPALVTAVVALAVIALTAAVLGVVHPRTDVGGATPTLAPSLGSASCHPAQVLPFRCGTYESTYGGKAITGDLGGPAKDRLLISFTPLDGALLLTARTTACFGERVLVRVDGKRLVRSGKPVYSGNGCFGPGVDRRSWAYAFLNGPLDHLDLIGPSFGAGDSAVSFQYQGAAPIGAKQLPRNDSTCVPAHVAPFSCGTYFSSGGTGPVAFLGTDLFRLSFLHIDGQLTAELDGRCNSLGVAMEPDGDTLVVSGVSSTAMGCGGAAGAQDDAILRFFSGILTYRITGSTIEFRSGSATASFTSAISACHPASSPFCGTYRSADGNGPMSFARTSSVTLAFAQSGSQTTATVRSSCWARTYAVAISWSGLRFRPLSSTRGSCAESTHVAALDAFLRAGVTWRADRDRGSLSVDRAASGAASSIDFTR